MPNPMLITVPMSDEDVAAEIQTRLSPHVVRPEPKVLNLETITLIVEIMSGSADIVAVAGHFQRADNAVSRKPRSPRNPLYAIPNEALPLPRSL